MQSTWKDLGLTQPRWQSSNNRIWQEVNLRANARENKA